jgi:muconate cycloisomerase
LVREDDLILNPIVFEKGAALLPEGSGLGVQLDLKALEKYATGKNIITTAK